MTLTAKSASDESIVAAVSGVLRRDVAVQVDHAYRRWLIGTFRVGMGFDTYASYTTPREDERFFLSARAGLQAVARNAGERRNSPRLAEVEHRHQPITTANTALIGVKWSPP